MKSKTIEISMYRIGKLLHDIGWSQNELARRIGVSQQTIQQWVSGKASPKPVNLDKLSEITGYPIHWFLLPPENDDERASTHNRTSTSRNAKIIALLNDLPDSDAEQIIRDMELRHEYYERKLEELLQKRNKPA